MGDDEGDAALERLLAWSLARGVRVDVERVEVRASSSGRRGRGPRVAHRGVFAKRAIASDASTDVIVIPRSCMIACEEGGTERRRDAGGGSTDARDELALLLLRHRSNGSSDAFAPYVASMPTSYNLLQSWTEEEIEELQDSRAKSLARRRRDETLAAFRRVRERVRELIGHGASEDEAFAAYEWARATVSSRAVSVPFHAAGALCPMGDMFNYAPHDPPVLINVIGSPTFGARGDDGDDAIAGKEIELARDTNSTSAVATGTAPIPGDGAYDSAAETFAFRTAVQPDGRRGVDAGEEIFVCYGEYSNLELLDYYGFTLAPDENPQDYYVLDVRVDANDDRVIPLKVFVGGFSWNDLADVRIAFATKRGYVKNEKELRDVARRGGALGEESELETFTAIRDTAAEALLGFPTTAKMDIETLQEMESSAFPRENVALAVAWRLGAKRILQRAYKWADARVAEIDAVRDAAARASRVTLARVSMPKPRPRAR